MGEGGGVLLLVLVRMGACVGLVCVRSGRVFCLKKRCFVFEEAGGCALRKEGVGLVNAWKKRGLCMQMCEKTHLRLHITKKCCNFAGSIL